VGILAHREHLFLSIVNSDSCLIVNTYSPDREHFSKKTGIGVHDAITPHGHRLLQALEPAKLLSLTGDK